jgi:hypothetical protein
MPLSIQIGADLSGIAGPSKSPSPRPSSGFKFSVDTRLAGSASDTFVLPLNSVGIYNFEVDWGDGTTDTITSYNQAEVTHTYSSAGIYTIECTGALKSFSFNNTGDKLKIKEIFNWGGSNLDLSGIFFSFAGCNNLTVSATDSPANTGDIAGAFYLISSAGFTGGLSGWDMSSTGSCQFLCYLSSNYNEDISGWDVSSITNFTFAFTGTGISVANYDALLIGWSTQTVQSGVTFSISSQYTAGGAAAAARATLVSKGWTITDGGSV